MEKRNEIISLRFRIDKNIEPVLKKILTKKGITFQEFGEQMINQLILENLNIVIGEANERK